MSEGYVDNRFVSLYYKELRQGIPLIMLHGNGENREIFSRLAGLMSRYYRVILMDGRDHDASHLKEEARAQGLTISEMAEDAVQVMEVLHVLQAVILGFSDGANVTLETASQYPDKVLAVVAVSGNTLPRGMNAFFYVQVRAKYALWYVMEKMPPTGPMKEQAMAGRQSNGLMARQPRLTKTQLSQIQAPVLILTGCHDLIRLRRSLWVGEQIMDAKVVFVKGVDHFTLPKEKKAYVSHIAAWLREKGL